MATCNVVHRAIACVLVALTCSVCGIPPIHSQRGHNTEPLQGLQPCTDWERVYQAGWFTALMDHISNYAACSKDQWLDGFQALNPGGKRVLIDIGCNKGYTSAQFFAMWQPQRGFSPNHLFRYYNNTGVDCLQTAEPNITDPTADLEVHCFEPSAHFHSMLSAAHEQFFSGPTARQAPGQWVIHNTIVSNVSGVELPFPKCDEEWSCSLQRASPNDSIMVPSTTVDDFVASRGIQHVDVLKIDAEGFDPAVLSGAVNLLENKAVGVLVFEYHSQGLWYHTSLHHVVSWLQGLGYGCFFDVNGNNAMAQLTQCWSAPLEIHSWSNVVCALEGPMLEWLAQHSLLQREYVRGRKRHHEATEVGV